MPPKGKPLSVTRGPGGNKVVPGTTPMGTSQRLPPPPCVYQVKRVPAVLNDIRMPMREATECLISFPAHLGGHGLIFENVRIEKDASGCFVIKGIAPVVHTSPPAVVNNFLPAPTVVTNAPSPSQKSRGIMGGLSSYLPSLKTTVIGLSSLAVGSLIYLA